MTQIVGILNITPDSFSDGGQFVDPARAIAHAEQLFSEGAAIVDVGAESTRPNAEKLSDTQEWQRLEPVLEDLISKYPGRISLDSYHPATMERALELGRVIMNDVTAFHNPAMRDIAVEYMARVIVSHLPGTDIQAAHTDMPVTTVEQVRDDLLITAHELESRGLPRENIILDPGIGFGKTMEVNWELLKFAALVPEYNVMIGHSRKRFLGEQRMEIEPNLAAGRIAIEHGAAFLRVHDVASHARLLQ